MNDCEHLIRDFCALAGLADPEYVGRGAPLSVSGITCSIATSGYDEQHALVLYCDFGVVPAGNERAVYQELLAQTLTGAPMGGVLYGFSAVTKSILCIQHLRASDVSAQRLIDILHHLADKAIEWRRTHFLEPQKMHDPCTALTTSSSARAVLIGGRTKPAR